MCDTHKCGGNCGGNCGGDCKCHQARGFTKFGSILHEVAEIVVRTYRDNGIVRDAGQVLDELLKKGGNENV